MRVYETEHIFVTDWETTDWTHPVDVYWIWLQVPNNCVQFCLQKLVCGDGKHRQGEWVVTLQPHSSATRINAAAMRDVTDLMEKLAMGVEVFSNEA